MTNPLHEREWAIGVSVYDDFDEACAVSRRYAFRQGSYIARIVVPEGAEVEFRQTFDNEHHYTIYAEPERLLRWVVGMASRIPDAPGE